ncbi:MAG: helix-turn-helix transcriptional regulator [Opitutaceae bacterium]|nr:helix-turn-helix transcriptional regulator [Cephaloticoccus sp.]MCP5530459.1 helix-turn-helix transcriptional regulator [Opitutaceae bacterium]
MSKKYLSVRERSTYRRLEDVIGCKWSAGVVAAIGEGVRRPGELERYIPRISKKILNERLRKLVEFELVTQHDFNELKPHVEYRLTPMGVKLTAILQRVRALNDECGKRKSS